MQKSIKNEDTVSNNIFMCTELIAEMLAKDFLTFCQAHKHDMLHQRHYHERIKTFHEIIPPRDSSNRLFSIALTSVVPHHDKQGKVNTRKGRYRLSKYEN